MDVGALSLLITEQGFAATMQKVAAIDAAAARVGARPAEVRVSAPTVAPVQASLTRLQQTASGIAGQQAILRLGVAGVEQAERAIGSVMTQRAQLGATLTMPVATPNVAPALTALETLRSEAIRVSTTPAAVPVPVPNTAPAIAALGTVRQSAQELGQLSATVRVLAPGAADVQGSLTRLQQTVSGIVGTPATLRLTLTGVGPAVSQLTALQEAQELARTRAAALAATLAQVAAGTGTAAERAQTLRAALDADSASTDKLSTAARSLSIAEREGAEVLRLRTAATNQLIAAQNELARSQSTGARVRAAPLAAGTGVGVPVAVGPQLGPATPEREDFARRSAQTKAALEAETAALRTNAQASAQATKATQQLGASKEQTAQQARALRAEIALAPRQLSQLAAGADLSSKTQVEAIRRVIAEQRAWMQSVGASEQQLARFNASVLRFEQRVASAGNAAQGMSPKVRSAANGLAAIAFAASSATPNMQSMALAAGLVGASLADAFGPGKIGMYASGIGALIVVAATAIGIYQRLTQATTAAGTAQRRIGSAPDLETAQRRYEQLGKTLEGLRREYDRLASKSLFTTTIAEAKELEQIGNEITAFERAQNEALEGLTDRRRDQARAIAVAQSQAAISAANDQLRITQSLIDRQDSLNSQGYALGQIRLSEFFDVRQEILERRLDAEIAATRVRVAKLQDAAAPSGEKPDETINRRAERDSALADLRILQDQRTRTSEQFMAEREAAERALAQRILGFERQRLEAQGQTHQARMQQIALEAEEFARTLGQKKFADDPFQDAQVKADMVNAFRAALISQERFNEAQRESGRILAELATERERIQGQVERGQISELEGERQIADAERARVPALQQIAASMLAFATELNNPELIDAAKRLNAAIGALGVDTVGPLDQRFRSAMDALERAGDEGDGMAKAIQRKIRRDIEEQGGLTLGIKLEAVGLESLRGQIQTSFASFGINAGGAFGDALSSGISAALTKGSGKNFFEAFGNTLLQGLGNIFVQMGAELLTYGLIMQGLLPFLSNPFTSGPAAIAAGTALIFAGAAMGAIASNNSGRRTGSGAGQQSAQRPQIETIPTRVLLDPDRHLRERRAAAPIVRTNEAARAVAPPQPIVNHFLFLGTPTPQTERFIARASVGADGRRIPLTRKRR